MQLSVIRNEVRARLGLSNTDNLATDAVVTSLINGAYRSIALMHDWDWLLAQQSISVIAGDDEYTVAADWRTTVYVGRQINPDFPDGYSSMSRVQISTLRSMQGYYGPPTCWAVESGVLRIGPAPSESWTLLHVYLKEITALSSDADVPFIPDAYIDLLIVRAAKMLATRTGNREQLGMLREEEADLLQGISDESYRARGAVVPSVRSDTTWGG